MPECFLTERQENLLRSLVEGLNDGSVQTEWSYGYSGKIWTIGGLDGEIWRNVWKDNIEKSDFDTFVVCGYFFEHSEKRLALNAAKILHDFGDGKLRLSEQEKITLDSETMQHQFLETIARAYPRYLLNKGKGRKYYIKIVYSPDRKQIVDVDGFHGEFYPSHKIFLTIPTLEFLKMVPEYFSKARGGNYYIHWNNISEYLDRYKSSDPEYKTQPLFLQISTSNQFQCDIFMVMPFRDELNPVYQDHIKKVVSDLNLDIKRGDDPFSQHDIITEIWSLINNCKLVIADCTGKNPNVFYEMGLAHAIGKTVIPITQTEEDIPFDIRQRRFIKYDYTPRGMSEFEEQLKRAIQSILG